MRLYPGGSPAAVVVGCGVERLQEWHSEIYTPAGAKYSMHLSQYSIRIDHVLEHHDANDTIDHLVRDSEISPIIVVQGDHGFRLFEAPKPDDTCLVESFAILNALRLPGVPSERLYDSISPVNTFRLIFDSYFGTELGHLEDRSYFANYFGFFNFVDVSDRVTTCTGVRMTPKGPVRATGS